MPMHAEFDANSQVSATLVVSDVHEDAAHLARGDGEEVRAVLPVDPAHVDHAQIDLVDQRVRLERVAGILPRRILPRTSHVLGVHEGNELVERIEIAIGPPGAAPSRSGPAIRA